MATKEEVIGVLRKCYDPEIPINIYDLGLVYNIDLKPDEGKIDVKMTLTAPGCPASAYIHQDVKRKLEQLQGVKEAVVNIVWEPPWTPEVMSGIFPLDAVAKVECYVCGFVAETKAMPSVCPSCGAARYAFEKEIALAKAWEIASETDRHSAVLFRASAAQAAGATRTLLEDLAKEDEGQAVQADRQLAELRA